MNNSNYDIAEHSSAFWVIYLAVAVIGVVALMGLFLYGVSRGSRK